MGCSQLRDEVASRGPCVGVILSLSLSLSLSQAIVLFANSLWIALPVSVMACAIWIHAMYVCGRV